MVANNDVQNISAGALTQIEDPIASLNAPIVALSEGVQWRVRLDLWMHREAQEIWQLQILEVER